jgi:DNA-binding response OmpR family regulator
MKRANEAIRPGMHILVVDDDPALRELLRTTFELVETSVEEVGDAEAAGRAIERRLPDVIVLDVGLPGMDGFDVCRRLRARSRVPIVMLTARDEEPDRVAGLELGADDYLTKPFSPRELVARMKAVLRRAEPPAQEELVLGDVVVRQGGREVLVAGEPVELTVKEFDLLAFLVAHPGIVFTREQLLDRVWGMTFAGGTRTVDVHVAQVRRKLGRPELVQTVRGAGYKAARR